MPNWIANRLTIECDAKRLDEVLAYLKGDNGVIDFNSIKRMPLELDVTDCSDGSIGLEFVQSGQTVEEFKKFKGWDTERIEESVDLGLQYYSNIKKHGHKTWYGWRIEHWGTKWNASEPVMDSENEIYFETAWAGVPELMSEVVALFPDVKFYYVYADEDAGYNTGNGVAENGELCMTWASGATPEAMDNYTAAWGFSPNDYE